MNFHKRRFRLTNHHNKVYDVECGEMGTSQKLIFFFGKGLIPVMTCHQGELDKNPIYGQ